MKLQLLGKVVRGQDGAIWGDYLFRFGTKGDCFVYGLDAFSGGEAEPVAKFRLDKADIIAPHSNVVMFGNEYFCEGDEFPLLYSNIYNNYSRAEEKMKGITCVYRIQREGSEFTSRLVQLIEIGFVEDTHYWKSPEGNDVRPYGNFVIDPEASHYYAFTMRDGVHSTRYFRFTLPKVKDGVWDQRFEANRVVLSPEDILGQFDCEYHYYVQGATYHQGKIYSLEGFTNDKPALRIIDPHKGCQLAYLPFGDLGLTTEPELIDFARGNCYFCDVNGNLYTVEF